MTAFATLGDAPIISATMHLPLSGVWHADVVVDVDEKPSADASLVIGDSEFVGTIKRGDWFRGAFVCRIVGGKNGFGKLARPNSYSGASSGLILLDIVGAAGEKLSTDSSRSVEVSRWSVIEEECGRSVGRFCVAHGLEWRVRPDGETWVGTHTWPEAEVEFQELAAKPNVGVVCVAPETANILPGTTLSGTRVGYVTYVLSEQSFLRANVWSADA